MGATSHEIVDGSFSLLDLVIGCGQGGGRLAKAFADAYNVRALYFNLTDVDFQKFSIRKRDTFIINAGGSGRDPVAGEAVVRRRWRYVSDALDGAGHPATVALCVGGGGGSGVGFMWPILERLRGKKNLANVLLVYTLPQKKEGVPVQPNALKALDRLIQEGYITERGVGTLLVDNDYCYNRYHKSGGEYWLHLNYGVAYALGRFVALTDSDHARLSIDAASGFKAVDMQEIRRVLFFGGGFLDVRELRAEAPAEMSKVGSSLRTASLVNSSMQAQTAKSYIAAVGMPESWKTKRGALEKVDEGLASIARLTKTPYAIQATYYGARLKSAVVSVLMAGLTHAKSLDRQVKVAQRNIEKIREKPQAIDFDIQGIEL